MTTEHVSRDPDNSPGGMPVRTHQFSDLLILLVGWKKFILTFVLGTTLIAVIVSLLLPKWYRSTTSVLLPKNQSLIGSLGNLSSLLKEFAPISGNRLGGQVEMFNYLAILESRRMAESLITHFDLRTVYGIDERSMEDALKEFENNYEVEVGEEGSIRISVYDRDPRRAAEMANYTVALLNEISIEMGSAEARENKEFLARRVTETRSSLKEAEEELKNFQERQGMIFMPSDVKSSAESVSDLYAKNVQLDVQLAILRKTVGTDNSEYQQLSLEKNELEKKLGSFPQIGLTSFRLYRDALIQQKVLEFLIPLYEQARIEERKDIPVVSILDGAVPAEKKSRPKRWLIVATTFLSSWIVAVILVLLIRRSESFRADEPDRYDALMTAIGRRKRP